MPPGLTCGALLLPAIAPNTDRGGHNTKQETSPVSRPGPEGIKDAIIRQHLQKVAAHGTFSRSQRMARFLRFPVERTLAGQGDGLKEYLIGMEVFDRPASYDPRVDPIVRVEARRLR